MIIKLASIPKVIWNIAHKDAQQTAIHHFERVFGRTQNLKKSIAIALSEAKKVGPIAQGKEIAKQVIEKTEENIQKKVHPSLF